MTASTTTTTPPAITTVLPSNCGPRAGLPRLKESIEGPSTGIRGVLNRGRPRASPVLEDSRTIEL